MPQKRRGNLFDIFPKVDSTEQASASITNEGAIAASSKTPVLPPNFAAQITALAAPGQAAAIAAYLKKNNITEEELVQELSKAQRGIDLSDLLKNRPGQKEKEAERLAKFGALDTPKSTGVDLDQFAVAQHQKIAPPNAAPKQEAEQSKGLAKVAGPKPR